MPQKDITVTVYICNRCDHEWQARPNIEHPHTKVPPTVCAGCKSPYWDKPRRNASAKKKRTKRHAAA
jgi:hypothetical protein